jgi:NitT/TauT family transport system substrate-binding protein
VSSYLQAAGGAVGMLGGLDDKPAEIKANGGADPVAFAYSDFGVNQVGYCIVTKKDTAEKKADLVKRFMAATVKSYQEGEKNPDAAVNAMADIVGGTMADDKGKAQSRAVLDVTLGILYSASNKDKRLGYNVPADWDSMLALMKQYNDLKTDQPATTFYSNDFLP